jgi:hypothetical protein
VVAVSEKDVRVFIIRLAVLYLVAGVVLLLVQLSYTPCTRPLVLDDGQQTTSGPINLTRLGNDRSYAMSLGKDVVFWLPRFVDYVVMGNMSPRDFLFAKQCKL